MYPIHDYHLYFSSAGAQADVRSLYYTIIRPRDVSLAKLLIEKGESKYSTGSNELFVLGGVCIGVCFKKYNFASTLVIEIYLGKYIYLCN